MKKLVVVLAIAMLLVPAALFGQQVKGDKELGLNGNLMFSSAGGATTSNGNIFLSLGYFVTRQMEVKFGGGINISATPMDQLDQFGQPTGQRYTMWNNSPMFNAGFVYNFAAEGRKAFPYIGTDFQTVGTVGTNIASSWENMARPNGGVKVFFKRNIAFDTNFGYDKILKTGGGNQFDARMGFLFVF